MDNSDLFFLWSIADSYGDSTVPPVVMPQQFANSEFGDPNALKEIFQNQSFIMDNSDLFFLWSIADSYGDSTVPPAVMPQQFANSEFGDPNALEEKIVFYFFVDKL
ncbi:hypothetical protein niasHT_017572 [Heterodera trifolii]|uniref:Uncharacterized protein n=1 Tax=Heterodera trifolii TaxID=157864 RepID=A0ABD2LA89_9BILA